MPLARDEGNTILKNAATRLHVAKDLRQNIQKSRMERNRRRKEGNILQ